jgi:hypothetical protein
MITEAMMVVDEEAAQYAGQACAHAKSPPTSTRKGIIPSIFPKPAMPPHDPVAPALQM